LILILFQGEEYFELVSWVIVIALLFLSFALFVIEAIKTDEKSRKMVYIGYGLFALCFGLTRLLFFLTEFCGGICDDFFHIIGYLTGIAGIIVVIFIMETYLLKTKKILTFITIILFGIILIALTGLTTRDIVLNMIYILLPFALVAVALSYIYFIFKTSGPSRKKAIGALLGMILIFLGHLMSARLFLSYFPDFPLYVAPIIMIIGVIFFTISQLYIKYRS
jgi:hypothetical protein